MLIDTKKPTTFNKFIKKIYIPKQKSHKGENGKVLIIGGSKLFHSASIWAAEMASYIVDMVHYSSTQENNEIMISVKKKFLSGIVIDHKDIPKYVKEDDAILIGPGMVRGEKRNVEKDIDFKDILSIKDESHFARCLIYYLIRHYPKKQFVFDAGALQMMDKQWLLDLTTKPILTPHTIEFERLFGISLKDLAFEGKKKIVKKIAKEFNCVILYKGVKDIISDGDDIIVVEGGNSGLSKGGTGDVLASLCCSFSAKNDPILSAVISSILIKKTADKLFLKQGYWYNVTNLIEAISYTLKNFI